MRGNRFDMALDERDAKVDRGLDGGEEGSYSFVPCSMRKAVFGEGCRLKRGGVICG
jgi:hypothetical protein